jgi:DnaJ-class molecular chaperone
LLVKVKIQIPTVISARQRQLLEEFARLGGEHRAGMLAQTWQTSTRQARGWFQKLRGRLR